MIFNVFMNILTLQDYILQKITKKSYSLYMIKNLSPSRASQFKTCPKQFKFANVDKIKEPTTEVQAKGTTVHQALEDLYNLPKEERTSENLYNLFRSAWTKVRNNDEHVNLFENVDEEKEWGVDALNLLSNYLTLENPKEIEPLEKEKWVRGTLEDLNLRGILDRMDRDKDGKLIIIDYKSGKAPMAKYKEPRFFAMKLYALLIKDELGEMPKELKLIYLKNSTIHTLQVEEETLLNAKEEILQIWGNIKIAYKENHFPAIKNTLCDWCYYKPICPEYNEEAPDTDQLQQINNEIDELKENLEAMNMFENPEDIPKESPIKNIDKEKVEKEIENLNIKKTSILYEIEKILREQTSS